MNHLETDVTSRAWGDSELWILTDPISKVQVSISTLGATIISALAPDAQGVLDDVVLGFAGGPDEYRAKNSGPYFGAIVGRVANRIQGRSRRSIRGGRGVI